MCDNDTQQDVEEYLRRHPEMTRRDFTKLATGAGLACGMDFFQQHTSVQGAQPGGRLAGRVGAACTQTASHPVSDHSACSESQGVR